MKRWLSRRDPRYLRALVYLLQSSEYTLRDFWQWHERVSDFTRVEKRGKLRFTRKAQLLYGLLLVVGITVLLSALVLFVEGSIFSIILAVLILVEIPLILLAALISGNGILRLLTNRAEQRALSRIAKKLTGHRGTKIAIAGSYGKTTMRELLKTILAEGKRVAAPPENHNTPLAIASFVDSLQGDEEIIIFELGEYYPGDIRALGEAIRPEWGIITGINEAHLERMGSLLKTRAAIHELTEFVREDQLVAASSALPARGGISYDGKGCGAWGIREAHSDLTGMDIVFEKGGKELRVHAALYGTHLAAVVSAAAQIAESLGLSETEILRGISRTKPFSHRLEPKEWGGGVWFVDDSYNGNPDGAKAAITFLSGLSGRRFYVTPGFVETGERMEEVHEELGAALAASGIENVVLMNTPVRKYITSGLEKYRYSGKVTFFEDMPEALQSLRANAISGDIILVQNDWGDRHL
jgi:UDP-N-acetylmuramoyl-tripeptide--D-alanyl-D-alanine ligase